MTDFKVHLAKHKKTQKRKNAVKDKAKIKNLTVVGIL